VRLNRQSLPLLDEKGRPFPLLQMVKTLAKTGEIAEWRVWVQSGTKDRSTPLWHLQECDGGPAGAAQTQAAVVPSADTNS
jgi:hypothetical protein